MHWCLCDGTTTNGLPVPDLRGRMIRGASDSVPAGSTGGSEKHSHSLSGTVGATTLTVEQLASHKHGGTVILGSGAGGGVPGTSSTAYYLRAMDNAGGSQPHTHTLDGASEEESSLPPYYTLAYIMRCA